MKNEKTIAYIISEQCNLAKHTILNSEKCDSVIVEVELQDGSELNRNRREYPKAVLDGGLNGPNIKELIRKKSWVGEAGHPMKADLQRQMSIDHERISHRINKWWWDGEKVMGHVETLNTKFGEQMKNVIRQELETAYSLRAVGPVTKKGNGVVVQKPLSVLTYDWVFIPSHRNSYQRKIICDGTQNAGLSESYCLPISEASTVDYISEQSENFKLLSNIYDFSKGSLELSENMDGVIFTTSDGKCTNKMHMRIEDYITRDINEAFDGFRK